MSQFLWDLPPEEAWAMGMKAPFTPFKMVEALECALVNSVILDTKQ